MAFGRRSRLRWLVALVPSLLLPPFPTGRTQDAPKTAPIGKDAAKSTLDADLQSVRSQIKVERWAEAARVIRRIFEDNRGSEEVLRRAGDLEEDLKLCLFRAQVGKPSASDIFGPAATSFDPLTRKIVLEYPGGPRAPQWAGEPGKVRVLLVPLEGDVSMKFTGWITSSYRELDATSVYAVLCYDPEKGSGYVLAPGFHYEPVFTDLKTPDKQVYFEDDARILRMDGKGEDVELFRRRKGMPINVPALHCIVTRESSGLKITVDGKLRGSASDSKYARGSVAVAGAKAAGIVIRSRVEEIHYRAQLAAFLQKKLGTWLKDSWNREKEIPEWVRSGKAPAAAESPPPLPSDASSAAGGELGRALKAWYAGDPSTFLALTADIKDLHPRTKGFVVALREIADGRYGEALALLTRLIEQEPEFAPGWLYRGVVRFRLRDSEGALADLEKVRERARALPDLHLTLAAIAIQDGDLDRAQNQLNEARAAGAWTGATENLASWVQRSRRGPAWARRFETSSRQTVVASDHSVELCQRISRILESSFTAYTDVFPLTKRPAAPLRVQVFSSRAGYLEYSASLGRDLSGTAGAYFPGVRELVLFVPEIGREDFWGTVRHEGFHAFLHDLVEEVPPWFDEGWAQCMEGGREGLGNPKMCPLTDADREAATAGLDVEVLMNMGHEEFMKNAEVHYLQARSLVAFLYSSGKPGLRQGLRSYFESLRLGLSPREAFEKDIRPILDPVRFGILAWVRDWGKTEGR